MIDIQVGELTQFAEENGWIVVSRDKDHIRYLTPQGQVVFVELYEDGSIQRIVAS